MYVEVHIYLEDIQYTDIHIYAKPIKPPWLVPILHTKVKQERGE